MQQSTGVAPATTTQPTPSAGRAAPNPRLANLRAKIAAQDLEAILIGQADNRRYVSGFTGSAGYLLITADRAIVLTDFRYVEQVGRQSPDFDLIRLTEGLVKHLTEAVKEIGLRRLGFEAPHVSFDLYQQLAEALGQTGVELVPTAGIVEGLRSVKDAGELALIARAVAIADAGIEHLRAILRPGLTEARIAWELEKHLRENGADSLAFPTIVASGENAALPHHRTSDRPVQRGEPVIIDFGATVDGYRSDCTRTLIVGPGDGRFAEIYDLVLEAQLAGIAALRAGPKAGEIDAVARDLIDAAGHGEEFGHSLGHGIGLEVHELPFLRKNGEDILEPNQVVTIEPGVYIPGWGGVRIEDMAIVQPAGCHLLTAAGKARA